MYDCMYLIGISQSTLKLRVCNISVSYKVISLKYMYCYFLPFLNTRKDASKSVTKWQWIMEEKEGEKKKVSQHQARSTDSASLKCYGLWRALCHKFMNNDAETS